MQIPANFNAAALAGQVPQAASPTAPTDPAAPAADPAAAAVGQQPSKSEPAAAST
jgi:hypothetical protein